MKTVRFGLLLLALAAVYVAAAKLGLALAVVNPSATAVWAPTGIAIGANLLFGYRVWPAFLLGAFLANITTTGSVETSVAIAAGNTLEGFAGAWLVNRLVGGRPAFESPSSVFLFAVAAAGIAPIVSATIGVTSLGLAGYARWSDYRPVWTTWWLGDASGALIVAPLLVLWGSDPQAIFRSRSRLLETGALVLAIILTSVAVFSRIDASAARHYPIGFVFLPMLVWAALRLGPRITATAIFLLSALAVWGTLHGAGPFAVVDQNAALLLLQSFTGILSITALSLAAAVQQRDRLLLTEQQARGVAEAAVRARDEFLSIAAHELRTPVTALKGSTQLMRRRRGRGEFDLERFDTMLAILEDTADRLTRLVNDLLDVSRIRTGHLDLSIEPLDLAGLLADSVRRTQDLLADGHIYTLDLRAQPATAWGDPGRMDQVLANLLENAAKYSPSGGEIRIELNATPGDELLLTIHDSGIGLPPGAEETIFEPFGRAANAAARNLPGMGLGLYISRRIIEQHGGRIWAESPGEDQGTTMFVRLPRYTARAGAVAGA